MRITTWHHNLLSSDFHQELIPTTIANMRLLNIKTLKLEWFHSADVAPSYAILSHRWEDEEVLFEDVEERPEAQKLRSLQMKLEETERRLDAFYRKIEGGTQTNAYSGTTDHQATLNSEIRYLQRQVYRNIWPMCVNPKKSSLRLGQRSWDAVKLQSSLTYRTFGSILADR